MKSAWRVWLGMSAAGLLCIILATTLAAQQTPPPPPAPTPKPDTRVVGVVPAFNVATFDTKTPLTSGEKFYIFWRGTLDPYTLIVPAVKAGIYNAADLNSGFGSGASGFFQRYGAAVADGTSSRFFRNWFYPVLLHEDPRYFRIAKGTTKERMTYSLTRVFITRTDSGNTRFNWSKMLSQFTSSGLSNLYYPEENRGAGFTFTGIAFGYLGEAGWNVVKEFWPDISAKRKARKEKNKPPPSPVKDMLLNPR
jgi:hypothetical protein